MHRSGPARRGLMWERKPFPAGGRSCGLEGRPGPAAAAASCVLSEAVCEGTFPPARDWKRLVVVVRLGWWVCRPRCVRGLVRPRCPPWRRALGACRGAKVGARAVR